MPIPRIKIIIIFIIFIMLMMVSIYWEVYYISSKCLACGAEEHELWNLLPAFAFCPLAPSSLSLGRMLNLSVLCFIICKMGMKRVPSS